MEAAESGLRYTLASFGPPFGSDVIPRVPGGMMPEILTESFCERCGTRYTFESAAPRKTRRLGQIKTLSKGMKNWVMSDDTSLDEAMAAARNDDDRELTSQQLDAFHATFNFCMTCRQYTCGNCWNTAEGRCLTCAPHLGHEILPGPVPGAGRPRADPDRGRGVARGRPDRRRRATRRTATATATASTPIRSIPGRAPARPMSSDIPEIDPGRPPRLPVR